MVKKIIIVLVTVVALLVAAGVGVLIWWLLRAPPAYETIKLEGNGIGDAVFTAAFTRVPDRGDMFWWFYPAQVESTSKPVLLSLHGVTGVSPSFLANFGMFGPYDVHLNKRDNSWVNDYNLLFIDAPLGTGFSTVNLDSVDEFPNLDENVDHLLNTLRSFYDVHGEYKDADLYIFCQGDGSQLAIPAAKEILKDGSLSYNLKGIFLGNAVIAPALVLNKLGFYLEELAYIDGEGRRNLNTYTDMINYMVESAAPDTDVAAFNLYAGIGNYVNEYASAAAVNLGHIVKKVANDTHTDYFGEQNYLQYKFPDVVLNDFMQKTVAPALGISENLKYDGNRDTAIESFKKTYMKPIIEEVEDILENSNIKVVIYNGNLDAVSNTPGQLEWINNLRWSGQSDFLSKPRNTLVINRLIEGYFREADRLQFYWINAAGRLAPLDNPVAIKRLFDRATSVSNS